MQCSTCGFRGDAGQVKEHRGRAKECVKKEFERIGERDLEIEEILKKKPGLCTTKLFDAIFSSCSEHPHQYTKNCKYRIRMKTHRDIYTDSTLKTKLAKKPFRNSPKILNDYAKQKLEIIWAIAHGFREFHPFLLFSTNNPDVDI